MNKMWKVVLPLSLMFNTAFVFATGSPLDGLGKNAWNLLTHEGTDVHFLDNATGASLYDFERHEWLGGAMTSVYKPQLGTIKGQPMRPLSLDFGAASADAKSAVFPFAAVRFHGRDMLSSASQPVNDFFAKRENLLKYLTVGGWAARDWNFGIWRYGYFLGAEAKWGGASK